MKEIKTLSLIGALILHLILPAPAHGGILPPNSMPHGYSLDKMTMLLADFQETFDPNDLPSTPFQILYIQDFDTNTGKFAARPGTMFFIPVFSFDDSPPVIGDFPTRSSQVHNYIFSSDEIGANHVSIEVDGHSTALGASYLSSLVQTPNLPFGGSHTILLGAFLTPLPKGVHTIIVHETFSGGAFQAAIGGPVTFDITYYVVVR